MPNVIDQKKTLLNVFVSIFFKIILIVLNIFVRIVLVKTSGDGVNGLNVVFLSIVGFLSLADLGFGTAISYCMYKPIIDGDNYKVSALYHLFRRIYRVISIVIGVVGLALCPILPIIAKGYSQLDINIYYSFLLMLISVVISYLFGSRISLINAYKNNYISTIITSFGQITQLAIQVVVLYCFRSYYLFLMARIVGEVLIWILAELHVHKNYGFIIKDKAQVDQETSLLVRMNVKAMFFHKLGGVLVNSIDSIIISSFIGVVALGNYSNYIAIMSAMTSVIVLFFTPLTSTIGYLCASGSSKEKTTYFYFFYSVNCFLGFVFFLGYYLLIDDLVLIMFGKDHVLDITIKVIVTINYFIQFLRQSVLLFRDATGTFYQDRFKPIFEGILNVLMSIVLVIDFGVKGVIIATIVTNMIVCHIVEPHVLFKYGLKERATSYYLINYTYILFFSATVFGFRFLCISMSNIWIDIIVKGIVSIIISVLLSLIFIMSCKDLRHSVFSILFKKN